MKTNSAFRRSLSPSRSLAALALLGPGLFALLPATGHGAAASPDPSTYTTATCSYVNGVKRWVYRVDPPEVQSFSFTVTFDPARAQLNNTVGGLFKQPFTGVIDASQGAAGTLRISGMVPSAGVTPGDVDVFELIFDDLNPLLPIDNVTFTVGGGLGDFIQFYDPVNPNPPLPPVTGAATGPVVRSATLGISPMVWDPDGGYNNGTTGGAGNWSTGGTSFDGLPQPEILTGLAPADTSWVNGTNLAVFGGNPGTGLVNVASGISAAGIQFDMPGYQLSGGSLTFATPAGSVPVIEVRAGVDTVNTPISGNQGLKKSGAGTVVLGGVNDFTGSIAILSGNLEIGGSGQLGSGNYADPIQISAGSALRYFSGTAQTLSGQISGSGSLVIGGFGLLQLTGFNTFTGGTTLFSGVLLNTGTNSGGITQSGGTLNNNGSILGGAVLSGGTLTNNNSLAGGVTVSGNALLFNNGSITGTATLNGGSLTNNSGASVANITVQSGTLKGNGTVTGALAIGDGIGAGDAIFHPATAGPTAMSIGSLSLNSDAVFQLTLNSNAALADELFVSGGTTLGSGVAQLTVQDLGSTVLLPGTIFTIIDNAPSATMSGFFNGLPDGASFLSGLNTFQIDYDAGANSNDVQLTVTPEPTSSLLLVAALALGGARRLRSRRP